MDARSFFEDRYRRFGPGPKALDWSEEGQRRRFQVLAGVGDMSGWSVLDLGCGFGDLLSFLVTPFPSIAYHGVDFSRPILEEARRRHAEASFDELDVVRDRIPGLYDVVLSSGLHNLETGTNDEDMERLLAKAWGACRIAVAVNMLSARARSRTEGRHYYEPGRFLGLAQSLAPFVVLRHDYLPHDFTLYLYREARQW